MAGGWGGLCAAAAASAADELRNYVVHRKFAPIVIVWHRMRKSCYRDRNIIPCICLANRGGNKGREVSERHRKWGAKWQGYCGMLI